MYTNGDYFEKWMQKLYGEVCGISKYLKASHGAKEVFGEGELHLDNQDLCLMFHVSKRTLQRYRTDGLLPYTKRGQKIYYRASDVREFANRNGDYWDKKAADDATRTPED